MTKVSKRRRLVALAGLAGLLGVAAVAFGQGDEAPSVAGPAPLVPASERAAGSVGYLSFAQARSTAGEVCLTAKDLDGVTAQTCATPADVERAGLILWKDTADGRRAGAAVPSGNSRAAVTSVQGRPASAIDGVVTFDVPASAKALSVGRSDGTELKVLFR